MVLFPGLRAQKGANGFRISESGTIGEMTPSGFGSCFQKYAIAAQVPHYGRTYMQTYL